MASPALSQAISFRCVAGVLVSTHRPPESQVLSLVRWWNAAGHAIHDADQYAKITHFNKRLKNDNHMQAADWYGGRCLRDHPTHRRQPIG